MVPAVFCRVGAGYPAGAYRKKKKQAGADIHSTLKNIDKNPSEAAVSASDGKLDTCIFGGTGA